MTDPKRNRPYLILAPSATPRAYRPRPRQGGGTTVTPRPDRAGHAERLLLQIGAALNSSDRYDEPKFAGEQRGHYIQVTLGGDTPADVAQSLEDRGQQVEIASLTESPGGGLIATILVPERASDLLTRKVGVTLELEQNFLLRKLGQPFFETVSFNLLCSLWAAAPAYSLTADQAAAR